MGIKVHTIPVDPETRQVDLAHVARAINPNTIMVSDISGIHSYLRLPRVIACWLCNQLPGWLPGRYRFPWQARAQVQDRSACRLLPGQLHHAIR